MNLHRSDAPAVIVSNYKADNRRTHWNKKNLHRATAILQELVDLWSRNRILNPASDTPQSFALCVESQRSQGNLRLVNVVH